METPPLPFTRNRVTPLTCALRGEPEAMFAVSKEVGVDVPIPIHPADEMRMRSRLLVKKRRGIYVVVPSFDDDEAFELPDRLQKGEVFCERSEEKTNNNEQMINTDLFIKQVLPVEENSKNHKQ
jgi:hypothetical protein